MSDDKWGPGDRSRWTHCGTVRMGEEGGREVPLIMGEHKHSHSENKFYALLQEGAEPTEFDGHRILVGVVVKPHNYLKESELSGTEIRKGGSCQITADGEVVYEFFFRDVQHALLRAHGLIGTLMEHSSGVMSKKERAKLVGRAVYYHGVPAVITSLILDQGCIVISTADGRPFPPVPWRDDDEREARVKDDILSPHIWWWRDSR